MSILILKLIAMGLSRGTAPVRPICHSDLYLNAHINKVANTGAPLPGFMNTISHLYPAQACSYLGVCVSLADTSPPQSDPSLTTFGRSGETSRGVCGGQRQERGLLNQPAIKRPSINPPNGLGCGT